MDGLIILSALFGHCRHGAERHAVTEARRDPLSHGLRRPPGRVKHASILAASGISAMDEYWICRRDNPHFRLTADGREIFRADAEHGLERRAHGAIHPAVIRG